ncbi:sulfurtransferase [Thiosocius teredinicola]|uniref:sulfurtransferase n=1 Tax=Thiosocius teredinicola TaxID=1973002 RepID=UPI000990E8FB
MNAQQKLTTLVDMRTLAARLSDPLCIVVDCRFDLGDTGRGASAYTQSHITGARYAHLDHDLSSPITPSSGRHPLPDTGRLCDWLGRQGITPTSQVVVYDDSGGTMAVRLWWLLRWLGHAEVAVLDGGWQAWNDAGLPADAQRPSITAVAAYPGNPRGDMLVNTRDIEAQLQSGGDDWLLIDARTAVRFRGEAEPIDPVAGHIPGAVNLPLQQHLTERGTFKSADELRAMYVSLVGERDPRSLVAMCGSGVTACHNLLAMEIAGLRDARLYAGSWSEWIRDPARPVAVDV